MASKRFPNRKRSCFAALASTLLVLCCIGAILAVPAVGVFRQYAPKYYDRFVERALDVHGLASYHMDQQALADPALKAALEKTNVNPDDLAITLAGLEWLKTVVPKGTTPNIGYAMPLVLRRNESANGTNMGDKSSLARVCAPENTNRLSTPTYDFCKAQTADINWLLGYMQKHNVAKTDPTAAAYIVLKDNTYSDFIGAGVGEIGPDGWLPSTARTKCEEVLSKSDDPEIASCDFWSRKVSTFAKIHELWKCGYGEGLSRDAQITKMLCWNRSTSYVTGLVDQAATLKLALDDASSSFLVSSGTDTVVHGYSEPKAFIIGFLRETQLLPKSIEQHASYYSGPSGLGGQAGWLAYPVSVYDGISQGYSSAHTGDDFLCKPGTDVLAEAPGIVADPPPGSIFRQDVLTYTGRPSWGIVIFIYHGNHLHTAYYHMARVYVEYGQEVAEGQPIGECGHTGMSWSTDASGNRVYNTDASNHTHFEVEWTEEDAPITNQKIWSGAIHLDPKNFLGQVIDPANISPEIISLGIHQ